MSSPSDSKDEDEESIYKLIYDMDTTDDKEEKEKAQIPSSSGHTPVHLKMNAERRTHAVDTLNPVKWGLDLDALDNIQGIPVLRMNAEEKPWRKSGADISDYFNYGFDEESWSTYCKKQSKLRAANRKLYTRIMVQRGHTRHEEKESCSAYPSSGSSSILASRQSSVTIDVIGGQPGSSSRVEGRQCLSDEGNNTQAATEMSPEEDRITYYHQSPPSNFIFAYTSPPPFLYRPGPPPLSTLATLDSGLSKGFDGPSTSLYPCSSASVDRSREHGHDKDSQRDRDRESCSSSHNSGEERMRHRDTTERGHKRHSLERCSGGKEEQHQERRHRDKSEGWQNSSRSSSSRSRRDGGEDRNSQRRHKHKKPKRNRKDKETDKMFSADQERKFKSD